MVSQNRLIKKYPNRRLYDTATSTYITLCDVKQLVIDGCQFQVIDAKSGNDLTRSILLQIITEEESNGSPIFSSHTLYQIIRSYGDEFHKMMSCYLEKNLQTFMEIQEKLQTPPNGTENSNNRNTLDPETYTNFIDMQGPAIQGLMTNYLEQNARAFVAMQKQMQQQTNSMFSEAPLTSNMVKQENNGQDSD
ncbi:polyhydroxyalkanoate synthesis repressor PhaR [Burkholderiales bacterium]|jgi:polyhydroxyalkanoate synthesis repressor PhaR|nr:polyhydroxyalkanoate synthesis repressor PhaR [Burkholderiales bacterium]MDC1433683.1 polyhydroxyalkanoate synthesis repressor PhaR [Burkholderiales bacterium]